VIYLEKYLEENIEFFFTPPTTNPNTLSEKKSVLYLLRRDAYTCLKIDPTSLAEICFQARWPGIMTIMTGIDLLGQYYMGTDCPEGCGKRFKKYIIMYFKGVNRSEANILFQLRNALIHSFGLYARDSEYREYIFTLPSIKKPKPKLIDYGGKNRYIISDVTLHEKFEDSINKYYKELLKDPILQKHFEAMFIYHSRVYITK